MKTILDNLLSGITDDVPIRSILVGVHWTVVCSRHCGMAATLMSSHTHGHEQVRDAGHLHRKSARELAEYAWSDSPLEASLGVAAINSLLEVDDSRAVEINAADVLAEQGRDRIVAIVGHFPFVLDLRHRVRQLWVLELKPGQDEYHTESAAELIPQADVVAISGSALINHTLDKLLTLCRPGIPIMVLGPSTPLSPILFEHGITIISGTRVVDEAAVLRTVGQGASFRQVEGVKLLTFIREKDK